MTDGEDHEGETLVAASRATEQGAIIYTVGFGSPEGEPIPEYDARGQVVGFKRDDQGQVVWGKDFGWFRILAIPEQPGDYMLRHVGGQQMQCGGPELQDPPLGQGEALASTTLECGQNLVNMLSLWPGSGSYGEQAP